MWHPTGKKWLFGQDNRFFEEKKHLKIGYFCVRESVLPDFGRTWTANGWHQVNFRPIPVNLRVWRFKLAMWEVGGIKIEQHFSLCVCTESGEKVYFLVKRSVHFLFVSKWPDENWQSVVKNWHRDKSRNQGQLPEPRLYSKISDFQYFSVLGNFYALYHFVCHRYT